MRFCLHYHLQLIGEVKKELIIRITVLEYLGASQASHESVLFA